ncbi:ABC transporter B family member 9 [Zea mays]|uniref:ABC transporter B family member 9 n=1 Tax=Zea mays TaxID=4577 RepID=A0A1D6ENM1_MAIZE|nr:ABC transporter B family member 9 [Zea mays]
MATGEDEKAAGRVALHRLFVFADRTDAALMAVGAVAAVANGMVQPIMAFIFGDVIDAFGSGATDGVVRRVVQVSCWTIAGERQAARIRAMYLKAILRQDIAFFDMEMSAGQAVERMAGDTFLIQDAIGEKVGKAIQLLSTFIGGFIIAFTRGWLLALVMLSSVPPIAIAGAIVSKLMTGLSTRMQANYSDAGNVVEQTLGAIRTVVSFNGENQAITKYNMFIRKAYRSSLQEGAVNALGFGSVIAILFSSYGLAVWYGSKLIVERGYNGGMVISVIMSVMIGAMSLGQATRSVTAFAEGQGAAHRMFKIIERKPDIDIDDNTGIILEDVKGDVQLKDVYFSYPTRPEHLIFDGFSLQVQSGTTMALVGDSGSGKSTVISLVERFYDPQAGEVLIDGVDIRGMKLGWMRGKIGLVNQEPVLFSTTIRENIAYGTEKPTLEDINRAIQLANAAIFIDKLPNGLDTMVGEHGTQLSGGQKQRIAIARAIIKNPKILLLDEATSALDMESERVVQEALVRIMVERTTIVVAHRLSTVRNADVISVLQHGKMVEQGSHVDLMKLPGGAYTQLIRLHETQQEAEDVHPDMEISRRSTSKGSSSFGQSIPAPLGSPDPTEVSGAPDTEEGATDRVKVGRSQKKASIARLFKLNKPETLVLALGSIAAVAHGTIFPIYGTLISTAIKVFYEPPQELLKGSRFWAGMFALLGACAFVLIPVQYFLFGLAGGKLVERIFIYLLTDTISLQTCVSGSICARLSTDALNVKRLVGDNLALNVQTASTIMSGFTIAMVANWKLALVITVVIPFVAFQAYAQMLFLKGLNRNAKLRYEEASQVATDAVGGIRTVASFCAESKVMDAYENKCESPRRQGMKEGVVGGLGFGFSFVVFYLTYALCFYVGARTVASQVFFVLALATSGVSQTSAAGADSAKANDSAVSIFAILDRESKIDYSSEEGVTIASVRGDVDFQKVCFKYPLRPNVQIFKDFSLRIPSGKTVALVGESGSGKSTVIALLERFYDPESGKIFIDGVELGTLKVSWLRQQAGLVAQEPVLFNDTIRANIAYGKQGGVVSEEEVVAAAEAANAHGFIAALPDGYDTVVGERGSRLSGGQKQRVAIARAVVKDPRLLLLDEATSALDVESERVVQEALDRVMVGRTTVVVAHRLSTIRGADVIAVLKDGAVLEKGRHEELMQVKDGAYASLLELSSSSA